MKNLDLLERVIRFAKWKISDVELRFGKEYQNAE